MKIPPARQTNENISVFLLFCARKVVILQSKTLILGNEKDIFPVPGPDDDQYGLG